MSQQIVSAVACFLVFSTILTTCYAATMAPLCQPGIIEEMPPHIKKVCMALENSDQLSTALKSYINNEAASKLKEFVIFSSLPTKYLFYFQFSSLGFKIWWTP